MMTTSQGEVWAVYAVYESGTDDQLSDAMGLRDARRWMADAQDVDGSPYAHLTLCVRLSEGQAGS